MSDFYQVVEPIHQEIITRLNSSNPLNDGSRGELTAVAAMCNQLKNNELATNEFKVKILNVKNQRVMHYAETANFNDWVNRLAALCQ